MIALGKFNVDDSIILIDPAHQYEEEQVVPAKSGSWTAYVEIDEFDRITKLLIKADDFQGTSFQITGPEILVETDQIIIMDAKYFKNTQIDYSQEPEDYEKHDTESLFARSVEISSGNVYEYHAGILDNTGVVSDVMGDCIVKTNYFENDNHELVKVCVNIMFEEADDNDYYNVMEDEYYSTIYNSLYI